MATIEWRCSYRVRDRFLETLDLLQSLDPGSDDAQALIYEIRSLPGYPRHYDEDRDVIVPTPYKEHLL